MSEVSAKKKYDVSAVVPTIGFRVHALIAADKDEAEARFLRAYSKHECSDVIVRRASDLRRNKTCAPAV